MSKIATATGDILTDPTQIGLALLATRWEIWFTSPPPPPTDNDPLLQAYMHGRAHSVPHAPPISYAYLRGCTLAAAGAGVGSDGIPYEF